MMTKHTYANGLRLITTPMASTETVTVLVLVGTGSRYETKEINGISHFLEHLMFKGTIKRPGALDISEELDAIGAEYNAFTTKECTGYYVKCAAEKLDVALDVISDIFLNSKFDEEELKRERGPVKEEINMWFDNPGRYVGTLFDALMYGDQPLGWDIAGTKETIDRLGRAEVVSYFDTHYFAKNTVIAVAGKVDADSLQKKIEQYFVDVREHELLQPKAVIEQQSTPALKIFHKKTEQTHINIGFRSYSRFHPLYEALEMLATILGGGMSSRLFVEVRERRGLAYRIGSAAGSYEETGDFVTSAGISNAHVQEALEIILREHKKLITQAITEKELKKTKDYIKGKFVIGLEPSDAQASFYGEQELLEHRLLSPEECLAKYDAVTIEQIQQAASEIFLPERLNLALVGPFETEDEHIRKVLETW